MIDSMLNKQHGNFTVEFAIVAVFFSLLIAFSGDLIIKLSIKGKLDRMSYSASSIIKERTQLFNSIYDIDESITKEGLNTYNIVKASLSRTMKSFDENKFGYSLDIYKLDKLNVIREKVYKYPNGIECSVSTPDKDLFITTTWGRTLILYQVTLCYQTNNWFGILLGKTFNRVQSYSIVMGR